jgi:hypothetical protein
MSHIIGGMLARQIGTRGWLIKCTPRSYFHRSALRISTRKGYYATHLIHQVSFQQR